MSIYRCAICGSDRVVTDTQKEGYSVSKGILGTAIFGAVGAVMGMAGKDKIYYHCAACGQTLSYCMNETTKTRIDKYLANPNGDSYVFDYEKQEYFNINWDNAERVKTESAKAKSSNEIEYDADINNKSIEEISDIILKFYNQNKNVNRDNEVFTLAELQENLRIDDFNIIHSMGYLEKNGLITACMNADGKILFTFYSNLDEINNNKLVFNKKQREEIKQNNNVRENIFDSVKKLLTDKIPMKITEIMDMLWAEYNVDEFNTHTLSYYCDRHLVTSQRLNSILNEGCDKNVFEKTIDKKRFYYAIYGTATKIEEEKRRRELEAKTIYNEGATAFNTDLQKKIDNIEVEKAAQNKIYEENKKKIFGQGAKDKKQALAKINELDKQIAELKAQFKELK